MAEPKLGSDRVCIESATGARKSYGVQYGAVLIVSTAEEDNCYAHHLALRSPRTRESYYAANMIIRYLFVNQSQAFKFPSALSGVIDSRIHRQCIAFQYRFLGEIISYKEENMQALH